MTDPLFLLSDGLRVSVLTDRIPLSEVPKNVTLEKILAKLKLMDESLKTDFGIQKPKIAVLGLNPHAGDAGLIGKEEMETIIPAIAEAKKQGVFALGPYPADGFFANRSYYAQFDAVLAMYYDQGLIPLRLQIL